jgi:hypothetical protein
LGMWFWVNTLWDSNWGMTPGITLHVELAMGTEFYGFIPWGCTPDSYYHQFQI